MPGGTIEGDLVVTGTIAAGNIALPASIVTNNSVQAGAGIAATKLQQQRDYCYAQESATDCTSEARVVRRVVGATGTLVAFRAGNVVAAGAATTVTVDLKKNGSTVLSSTITLDNTTTAYTTVAAAGFTSASLVAGDVLEIVITLAGSNEPKGVFAQVTLREDPQ